LDEIRVDFSLSVLYYISTQWKHLPIGMRGELIAYIEIIWDLDDDMDGNVQHIFEHGVSKEEVEEILTSPGAVLETSKSSGEPISFGYTGARRYLAVVWEHVFDDPLTIYPITAYDVPEPRQRVK
jgi:hypothetical protein